MGCPYCKEPIQVGEPESEPPPIREALDEVEEEIEEPPSLSFRRMPNQEEGTSSPAEGDGEKAPPAPTSRPSGERRKHRRRQVDDLGWDEERGAESDAGSDPSMADDDSSEFLEMDPDSPGGVRLKRVRRKKVLTGKDKFIRGLTAIAVCAALAIVAFVIYSFVIQTTNVISTEAKTLQELPEEISRLIAEANKTPITDNLTQDEEVIAVSVLSGFLNAKSIDERLRFVRNQEAVRPLMEEWYSRNPEEAEREWPDAEILLRKKIIDQGRRFVVLAVDFVGLGQRVLAIEQTPDGQMRLDWPTTVGYQDMPLEEFKAERPTTPVRFWVKVKPADYYNHSFSDQKKYQAVDLSYPGRIDFKLTGYIDRETDWGLDLDTRLKAGEAPSLILELAYPEEDSGDSSQVAIKSIVSESWWE
ncbi:MAG: hypothetical protein ACR2RV_04955 [Verrucomicrobiales bacterium]